LPKIEGDLAEALTLLHNYFEQKGIPFALVGALVPAILLSSEIGVRETRDADHIIKLSSWAEWETVIADLVKLGFVRGRGEQEHRLHFRTAEIDLIPYGVTGGPDEVLVWRKSGNQMNLTGFSEVFEHAVLIEIVKGLTLPVIPLWLFAVLKVFAYLDRKFPRDLRDLVYVLEHYESLGNGARRFETVGEVSGVTYKNAGAHLLGADIRAKVSSNALKMVRDFLEQITDEYHSVINSALREEPALVSDRRRTVVYQLVQAFRLGLRG
jgi:predicted nucleotidyltransferase